MNRYTFRYFGYNKKLGIDDHNEINIEASCATDAMKILVSMIIQKRIFPKTDPQLVMINDISVVTALN